MRRAIIPLAAAALVAACGPRDTADSGATDSTAATPGTTMADSDVATTSAPAVRADSVSDRTASPASPASAQSADTLRGVVVLTGRAETATPVLRAESGSVALSGSHAQALAALRGLEIWASGRVGQSPAGVLPRRAMNVDTFSVRAADGVPAVDGMLQSVNDELIVVLSDGTRQPISNPPEKLRQHVGHRVWIAQQGGETRGFGAIDTR